MSKSQELIDDGSLTANEAAARLIVVESMLKVLKPEAADLRAFITDNLDPKDHITTPIGRVDYKRGRSPKYVVKDPVAYAHALIDAGEEHSTETVPYPLEFATKPDVLEAFVRAHGGEIPAGVELQSGSNDTTAIAKDAADWTKIMQSKSMAVQAREMLGIEAVEEPGNNDEVKVEDYSWDKI